MPDLVNKYPYTNFAGVNLDYILNMIHTYEDRLSDDEAVLNTLPSYVKDVTVLNNSALKVTFGSGVSKTFAIPGGTNFLLDISLNDPEDDSIYNMELNTTVKYDCNNITDYRVISDMFFSGVPTVMRILSVPETPEDPAIILAILNVQYENGKACIIVYDLPNTAWKVFQVEWDAHPYIYIKRVV